LSREELQTFFDYCDERVSTVARTGRKGWLAAFRDAALFKTVYAFGLRRQEAAMLDLADLSANPHARVRPVRRSVGPLREGEEGQPTAAAHRADHDELVGADPC